MSTADNVVESEKHQDYRSTESIACLFVWFQTCCWTTTQS